MDDNLILMDGRPRRADAVENRAHLLETAARLIHERGVEAVTMSEVAACAGVGKGTLYRNFPNKIALVQELLDGRQRELQVRTLAHLAAGGDPAAQLEWFVLETFTFVWENLPLLRGDDLTTTTMLEIPAHLWWRMTIRALLARTGRLHDPEYAADALYVLLDARTLAFQQRRGYDAARIRAGLREIVGKVTGNG